MISITQLVLGAEAKKKRSRESKQIEKEPFQHKHGEIEIMRQLHTDQNRKICFSCLRHLTEKQQKEPREPSNIM